MNETTLRAVERAVAALRRGETIAVEAADGRVAVVRSVEMLSNDTVERLRRLASSDPVVAVTGRRAAALKAADDAADGAADVVALGVPGGVTAEIGRVLADPEFDGAPLPADLEARMVGPGDCEAVAVGLARVARLLPATLVAVAPEAAKNGGTWAAERDLLFVRAAELDEYRTRGPRTLHRVAEARVPLEVSEATRIVAFRPADGGPEHLAIVIGTPDPGGPVLVRLHSECFTGDFLGSLRCDCGDQLRGAMAEIASAGAGILLYLAQEGRGIGLVNKLRAYRIQDRGFDTIDANERLGFDADERVYLPAAEMLRQLGVGKVRLMTNNPEKLNQLARCGIEVVERVPHVFPANGHSEFYLRTKAVRSGHMF